MDAMTEEAPGHDVRRFAHQVKGQPYKAFADFAEAAQDPDAAVVLSGDYGGTNYLSAPMRIVRCDERALNTLLTDPDAMTWMGGAESARRGGTFCSLIGRWCHGAARNAWLSGRRRRK